MKITLLLLIALVINSCEKSEAFVFNSNHDISIMSFNVRYDNQEDGKNKWANRKQSIIKMLYDIQPCVIGIQEGLLNQVEYLKENLPHYYCIGVGRDNGESSGEFNSLFILKNKFEILQNGTFWLSQTPSIPSRGWDAACNRIVTWAKLKNKLTHKVSYVFNTHLDHEGNTARKESAKLLIRKINEITDKKASVFITGDFNALIKDPILQPIIGVFLSAQRFSNYTDNKHSFNFFGFLGLSWTIDYIFYKNANSLAFKTITKNYGIPYISDHYPIIAYFNYQ